MTHLVTTFHAHASTNTVVQTAKSSIAASSCKYSLSDFRNDPRLELQDLISTRSHRLNRRNGSLVLLITAGRGPHRKRRSSAAVEISYMYLIAYIASIA
jgi:hypothetical protein